MASKQARYKQHIKDLKNAKNQKDKPAKSSEPAAPMTLRQRQEANKEALRKHQASMSKLKEFEAKLHPTPAGAEPVVEKERSALDDMMFDGSGLSKDASRTQPAIIHQPRVLHEKDTAIKH